MKLLIALDNNEDMESNLSCHFGHCPYFGIYENGNLEIIENFLDHKNTIKTPVEQVADYRIDLVFTLGIGKKAINLFREKSICVKTGNFTKLNEVIFNLDNLEDFKGGCAEH